MSVKHSLSMVLSNKRCEIQQGEGNTCPKTAGPFIDSDSTRCVMTAFEIFANQQFIKVSSDEEERTEQF